MECSGRTMPEHPPPADFDRLVEGTLSAHGKALLLSHLLRRCPRCCGALARRCGFEVPGEVAGEDYAAAIDRAVAGALRITAPRLEALAALDSLLADDGRRTGPSAVELPALQGLP